MYQWQKTHDLLIVGAGPAGALAAYTGARLGLSVLLLDRESFPRTKTCGGLLSSKTLAALPWPLPPEVRECSIFGFQLISQKGESLLQRKMQPLGATVNRRYFDQFLVDKARAAGAIFRDGTPCTDVERDGAALVVRTPRSPFRARVVIGADGFFSQMAWRTGIRQTWLPWETGLGLTITPSLPAPRVEELTGKGDLVSFFSVPLPASLGWCFPRDQGLNIGLGGPSLFRRQLRPLLEQLLTSLNRQWGIPWDNTKIQGWYLPAAGFARRAASGQVLLAGDAAGMVDPFSGEGIFQALRSGRLAAQLAAVHLSGDLDEPLAAAYNRELYRDYLLEGRLSLLLALLAGQKGKFFFRLFQSNPEILSLFSMIMENPLGYREALTNYLPRLPLFLTRTLLGP